MQLHTHNNTLIAAHDAQQISEAHDANGLAITVHHIHAVVVMLRHGLQHLAQAGLCSDHVQRQQGANGLGGILSVELD